MKTPASGRFLCVDVGTATDDVAAAAVTRAVAMASSWDRLYCFGRAAAVAARLERQDRAERDGIWLETSATWLLAPVGDVETPPSRPPPGPLTKKVVAVGRPGLEAGALTVAERVVELVGTLLVMAVPSEQHVDDVDNAHLWLVGGKAFAVDTGQGRVGGRAVVGVGGHIVGVAIEGQEATVTAWSLSGVELQRSVTHLGGANRMSVRGASA